MLALPTVGNSAASQTATSALSLLPQGQCWPPSLPRLRFVASGTRGCATALSCSRPPSVRRHSERRLYHLRAPLVVVLVVGRVLVWVTVSVLGLSQTQGG